jgi:hypothetical protein
VRHVSFRCLLSQLQDRSLQRSNAFFFFPITQVLLPFEIQENPEKVLYVSFSKAVGLLCFVKQTKKHKKKHKHTSYSTNMSLSSQCFDKCNLQVGFLVRAMKIATRSFKYAPTKKRPMELSRILQLNRRLRQKNTITFSYGNRSFEHRAP